MHNDQIKYGDLKENLYKAASFLWPFFELNTSFFNRNFKLKLIEYQDFYKINSVCLEMTLLNNDIIKHGDNDVEFFFLERER